MADTNVSLGIQAAAITVVPAYVFASEMFLQPAASLPALLPVTHNPKWPTLGHLGRQT